MKGKSSCGTKMVKMKKGGDVGGAKKIAKTEVKAHEKRMHGMKKGGGVKIRGTGAATKGTMARGPMA
jgi:hypothetical protein